MTQVQADNVVLIVGTSSAKQQATLAQHGCSWITVVICLLKGTGHMFGQYGKTFFLTLSALSLLAPLALMLWHPQLGAIAFFAGLTIAGRCIRLVQML